MISSALIAKARLVNQIQNGENWEKKILFVHLCSSKHVCLTFDALSSK